VLPALRPQLEGHGDIGDNDPRFVVYVAVKGFAESLNLAALVGGRSGQST
jgi:hypothetical protein